MNRREVSPNRPNRGQDRAARTEPGAGTEPLEPNRAREPSRQTAGLTEPLEPVPPPTPNRPYRTDSDTAPHEPHRLPVYRNRTVPNRGRYGKMSSNICR